MYTKKVLGLLLLCMRTNAEKHGCDSTFYEEMQDQFASCSQPVTDKLYGGVSGDKSVCLLVTQILEDCGAVWASCHSKEELRVMKEQHLQALSNMYQGVRECQGVQKYHTRDVIIDESGEARLN